MALLDVADLTLGVQTRSGLVTLVDGVSFSVAEGKVLGLAGESGAGKSLTGLAILGLFEPPLRRIRGEVKFEGQRIDLLGEDKLQHIRGKSIAAVFQDSLTSLNPLMTVGQHLTETIQSHLPVSKQEAKEQALQLLAETGIPNPRERLSSYPHELSGGMRQRVVIALAFCCKPKLIIADEPTTALDVSVQAQVIDLFMRMRDERGTSIVLITHDMGVIAEAADRLAVMYAGRMVEEGPAATVLTAPRHPYTQGLVGAIPRLGARVGRLEQIKGTMPRPGQRPEGCAFHPRCAHAMPRCLAQVPPFYTQDETKAACWLFEDASGERVHDRA